MKNIQIKHTNNPKTLSCRPRFNCFSPHFMNTWFAYRWSWHCGKTRGCRNVMRAVGREDNKRIWFVGCWMGRCLAECDRSRRCSRWVCHDKISYNTPISFSESDDLYVRLPNTWRSGKATISPPWTKHVSASDPAVCHRLRTRGSSRNQAIPRNVQTLRPLPPLSISSVKSANMQVSK